jgi:hypothetical protein
MPPPAKPSMSESDRSAPPWNFSTALPFYVLMLYVLQLGGLCVVVAVENLTEGGRRSAGFYLVVGLTGLLAALAVGGVCRGKFGQAAITIKGVEFQPWVGRAFTVQWADVDAARWRGDKIVLRAGGVSHVVSWSSFKMTNREAVREWVRAILRPAFDLVDVPPRLPTGSWRSQMLLIAAGCAPILLAWKQIMRDPESIDVWKWVFFAPLILPFLAAPVLIYRQRNRFQVWHVRRRELLEVASPAPQDAPAMLS